MWRTLTLALLAGSWTLVGALAQEPVTTVRYGITVPVTAEANPNDAVASSVFWARGMSGQLGINNAEGVVFRTAEEAVAPLKGGRLDLLATTTLEYLTVERRLDASPIFLFVTAGAVTTEYVLLVRAGVRDMRDLAAKRMAIYTPGGEWDLSNVWLETLSLEAGLVADGTAFGSMKHVTKKGQAVMALFFGQADAAIESAAAFEAAVELNPQVGRDVRILARSPKLLPGLVCMRNSMSPAIRAGFVEKAIHLHELPQYRQTFIVMRVTRLVAWDPAYLEPARALVAHRAALRAKKRPAR